MKIVPGSHLATEDRILWNRVARTTRPMPGKSIEAEVEPPEDVFAPAPQSVDAGLAAGAGPPRADRTATRHPGPHPLDSPTRRKLAKGRLPLEARIDLHGMTQAEAHSLLLSFLQRAHMLGVRHVLVITGKGSSSGGDGVLRRAVPSWFATPAFRPLVGGYENAARGHGGAGALYVRLRRVAGSP